MDTGVRLYNTLTKQKEALVATDEGLVRISATHGSSSFSQF
jgi:hypothetical protein